MHDLRTILAVNKNAVQEFKTKRLEELQRDCDGEAHVIADLALRGYANTASFTMRLAFYRDLCAELRELKHVAV